MPICNSGFLNCNLVRRWSKASLSFLIIGDAMSRLDAAYFVAVKARTWNEAYNRAAALLGTPRNSFKLLRDGPK
jgi:hypothetical protein